MNFNTIKSKLTETTVKAKENLNSWSQQAGYPAFLSALSVNELLKWTE